MYYNMRTQVLGSMAKIFPLFEPTDTLARDCLIVFAIGVAYKLLFVALFLAGTANASRNAPPAADGGEGDSAAAAAAGPAAVSRPAAAALTDAV